MKKPLSRLASTAIIGGTGVLSRLFLYGTQHVQVEGLEPFLKILCAQRETVDRGLLTVSNHKSVMDDPLMWGTLPLSTIFSPPEYMRHALGSADICFTNPLLASFFAHGNVHPTYRLHKSPLGGLFQPTMNALVLRLSASSTAARDPIWVHIFPEGRVHQHPNHHQMRYFKWGVSRFILEPKVQPVFVPMFITGLEEIMHETRKFPRFVPRVGKDVRVVYGDVVPEERFKDLRAEWRELYRRELGGREGLRVEDSERLREGAEAVELRVETTRRVRDEIVKLRRRFGYPEEEEGVDDPATYRISEMNADGAIVKDA